MTLIEYLNLTDTLQEINSYKSKRIAELEDRLRDAEEALRWYADNTNVFVRAIDYFEKHGVKQ